MRFKTIGRLQYEPLDLVEADLNNIRVVVWVDQSLSNYYRSLIPKWLPVQPQMHPAHITVVRTGKEVPTNLSAWGKYEGELVPFEYESGVKRDSLYYWLSVFSDRIAEIRQELGLPVQRDLFKGYHISIGNRKEPPINT